MTEFPQYSDSYFETAECAARIAAARGSPTVTTEHLLLALFSSGGRAGRVLRELGFDEGRVSRGMPAATPPTPPTHAASRSDLFSPAAVEVRKNAVDAARMLGQSRICTEHLLLGLLAPIAPMFPAAGAQRLLHDGGVTWKKAIDTLDALGEGAPGPEDPPAVFPLGWGAVVTTAVAGVRVCHGRAKFREGDFPRALEWLSGCFRPLPGYDRVFQEHKIEEAERTISWVTRDAPRVGPKAPSPDSDRPASF